MLRVFIVAALILCVCVSHSLSTAAHDETHTSAITSLTVVVGGYLSEPSCPTGYEKMPGGVSDGNGDH